MREVVVRRAVTVYDVAAKLPPIDALRKRCQSLAVLERVIDGGEPFYTFTCQWGDDEAALMSNGSGDEWAVVFTANGDTSSACSTMSPR